MVGKAGPLAVFTAIVIAIVVRAWRHRSEGIWNATPLLPTLRLATSGARQLVPLESRKRFVVAMADRGLPGQITIGIELLRDLADDDPVGFHQFLWANHLAYASKYGEERLAVESLEEDRRIMFDMLADELRSRGVDPAIGVSSVLDAGCSSGFMLRVVEVTEFPSATELVGIDIDRQAIEMGREHLREVGSRIELIEARMEDLEQVLDGRRFDISTCCGALMYLDAERAALTVAGLLNSTDQVVGLMARSHPLMDNRGLAASEMRSLDETWIHNVDEMVEAAGGRVVGRQWTPPAHAQERGLYIVLAAPQASADTEGA